MKLVCPNCDAKYEVPDDVIPTEGRDVQCSDCGQTWYQHHPDHPPEAAIEDNIVTTPDAPEPEAAPGLLSKTVGKPKFRDPDAPEKKTAPAPPPEPKQAESPAPATEQPAATEPVEEDVAEPAPAEPEPPIPAVAAAAAAAAPAAASMQQAPRELAPDVASILREEAEIETRARAREADTIETQPDLGLDEAEGSAARRAREARARMARDRLKKTRDAQIQSLPTSLSETGLTPTLIGGRRDTLPDIEDINSTMADVTFHRGEPQDLIEPVNRRTTRRRKRSAFRRGFALAVIVTCLAVLIYAFSTQIAAWFPQVDPWLSTYVARVDEARLWLNDLVADSVQWLHETAADVRVQNN